MNVLEAPAKELFQCFASSFYSRPLRRGQLVILENQLQAQGGHSCSFLVFFAIDINERWEALRTVRVVERLLIVPVLGTQPPFVYHRLRPLSRDLRRVRIVSLVVVDGGLPEVEDHSGQ